MGQWGGAAAAVLFAALVAPVASAMEVEGDLVVESGPTFPSGTDATLAPLAALVPETAPDASFRLAADAVLVQVHETRFARVGNLAEVETSSVTRSWRLTGVLVESISGAEPAGYLAFDAAPASALGFEASLPVTVEHRRSTTLSSHGPAYVTPLPEDPSVARYWREVHGPHLYLASPGTLAGETGGALKVQGLDLMLQSAENVTTLRTGREEVAMGESVVRWAHLVFDQGTLHVASPSAPLQLVASHAERVAWSGTARVVAFDGALESEGTEYASIGPAHVQGTLTTAMYPIPGELELLRLAGIRGDLTSTSLAPHPRAVVPVDGAASASLPVLAFLLGAALSAGALLGARALRARAPDRPHATPEAARDACLAWACFFEEQEDAAAALECLQAARRYADDDEYDLLLWEASCLDRLGRLEEALLTYEAAVAAAPKGDCEAAFAAAIVAGQLGRPDPALVHLRLSLMADPFLLEVVDAFETSDDDPFRGIRKRQGFRQLVRDARGWARSASELSE